MTTILKNPQQYCMNSGKHIFKKPITNNCLCCWCDNKYLDLKKQHAKDVKNGKIFKEGLNA